MSLEVFIRDADGQLVRVSKLGQLTIGPFAFDETQSLELAEDDTAYNFFKPKSGQQFVITGMLLKANRQVSNTVDARVVIYESPDPDSLTEDKILLEEAMIRGESRTINPMNVLVNQGKFINAKTSDDDIFVTIMGYYVPAL